MLKLHTIAICSGWTEEDDITQSEKQIKIKERI